MNSIARIIVLLSASLCPGLLFAADCSALKSLKLENTTITLAEPITSGTLTIIESRPSFTGLPPFCRVTGVLRPTTDSDIHFEIWLPAQNWNGRLLGAGNGGFAGSIGYDELATYLKRNFAVTGSDAGHQGNATDATWAYEHPEKVKDFGWRAVHLTRLRAGEIISAYYGKHENKAYFDSCSDGGREALMEAQRFPTDYNGILAGAPANAWSTMLGAGVMAVQSRQSDPRAYFSDLKLPAVQKASLAACDELDGVKDGIINDPSKCHFDPEVLLCKGEQTLDCLTQPQVKTLKSIYDGVRGRSGSIAFPGFTPGDELGWREWVIGQDPTSASGLHYVENYFRYMVTGDPKWNPLTADPELALRQSREKESADLDAIDPDLSRFSGAGGKLILYHGWNDQAISPWNTISYYQSIQQKMGDAAAGSFLRLYMAPGVEHCAGGPGPSFFGQFGTQTAKGSAYGLFDSLVNWVEKGEPENDITATKYGPGGNGAPKVVMTRPLCAYPKVVKYSGSGDTNDAENFTCAAP
ncbi:MAG TPA: tannase/feruloyl esterase family alpha/beta hydrolase [Terracidiphilus sp.]|nr:tannase/feruloyl esterase family alpha/beta hydrolase [Terracidiphilus sp.]